MAHAGVSKARHVARRRAEPAEVRIHSLCKPPVPIIKSEIHNHHLDVFCELLPASSIHLLLRPPATSQVRHHQHTLRAAGGRPLREHRLCLTWQTQLHHQR